MKKLLVRVLGFLMLTAGLLLGGAYGYFHLLKPEKTAAPPLRVPMTAERIARGRYLFTLADCDGCHSLRDFTRFGGPVVETGRGQGYALPSDLGLPGAVTAPNITPDPETGLGNWTDGEKIRAIREGISRDGTPLFPMMPYGAFRQMSDEDVQSLVAYLNTLPPVKNALPRTRLDFPVSLLIRSEPRPAGHVAPPDRAHPVKYGEYLATLAGCGSCHTPHEKGKPVPGMLYAGGEEFRFPGALVVSANITPDLQTGIGRWSEQDFLDRFYQYREYVEHGAPVIGPEGFTVMPWLSFSQLPPEDLKAIFAFLRTRKPVYRAVDTHPGFRRPS